MYIDAHIHCVELESLSSIDSDILAVCVSDDLASSMKTLEISEKNKNVIPCIGVHPWVIHEHSLSETKRFIEDTLKNHDVKCLGEVGLDKKFHAETFDKQIEFFKLFIEYAREYNLVLNLHAAGAWREVFNLVYHNGIDKAYFHWYTGPLDLLKDITSIGYLIGINAALEIQEKHRSIVEHVDLKYILTESDAPYEYRGLKLTPSHVKKLVALIAGIKGVDVEVVKNTILGNFEGFYGFKKSR